MKAFLLRWAVLTIAVLVAAYTVPGIHADGLLSVAVAALLLGLLNAFVKPILVLLTLPLTVLTLGLFLLVINALLLGIAAWLVKGFEVDGFFSALLGAIVIAVANAALEWLTGLQDIEEEA